MLSMVERHRAPSSFDEIYTNHIWISSAGMTRLLVHQPLMEVTDSTLGFPFLIDGLLPLPAVNADSGIANPKVVFRNFSHRDPGTT